jgi:hypothetical protein
MLGPVLVIFGALAIGLVLVGGVLMARLLTTAAERSDVWKRYGWPNDKGGEEHTWRKDL